MVPTENPTDLAECLKILETIKYESFGFPMVFLAYNYTFGYWDVGFRNAKNFENPEIKGETPLGAAHQMLDFLRDIETKRKDI